MERQLAQRLSATFLAAEWSSGALLECTEAALGRRPAWLPPLVEEVLARFRRKPLDAPRELATVISNRLPGLRAAAGDDAPDESPDDAPDESPGQETSSAPLAPGQLPWPLVRTAMVRNPWHLPVLDDLEALAQWLRLDAGELAWFTDSQRRVRRAKTEALQHYRITTRWSPSGSLRVLEAPKPRLRALQRRLLDGLLAAIPPHEAAHGFRRGRSVATFAAPHAGRRIVLRLDLESFFASVGVGRVYGLMRMVGYPEPVAHALAGLVTTVLPAALWRNLPSPSEPVLAQAHWRMGRRLAAPHLPQGAPTSPALANLAAFRLDRRLSALAAAWDGQYTRYADDLALSGGPGWRGAADRLVAVVSRIAVEEGFRVNVAKTRLMPDGDRQRLCGLVVNDRPRVARREVDLLRATLHNCARYGPQQQNRLGHSDFRAHLWGRIAWLAQHDPVRGRRLHELFAQIEWP